MWDGGGSADCTALGFLEINSQLTRGAHRSSQQQQTKVLWCSEPTHTEFATQILLPVLQEAASTSTSTTTITLGVYAFAAVAPAAEAR